VAQKLLERNEVVVAHLQNTLGVYPEAVIADHRYGFIKSIIHQGVVTRKFVTDRLYASDKIDKIVTHRLLGPLIMAGVLFGLYTFTFTYSTVPVDWLASFFAFLSSSVDATLPDGPLKSMLISGVIDGVGGVLGFVPIIMFMFFGIALLEDSGYLARVAFMMDRIFHFFGLHGSSVMPFIVSGGIAGGCAVPGVMAARTLRSPKERLATLLTVPFMNCGAKLPVLTLLIGAFFSAHQARYMFLATLAAWIVALCAAKFLRMTVLRGASTPFVMELPPYRFPTLKGLFIHTWERTWQYIKKAGTVILGISVLLWALMTYPGLPEERVAHYQELQQQVTAAHFPDAENDLVIAAAQVDNEEWHMEMQRLKGEEAMEGLRHSMGGRIGTALEGISQYAGIDWRTNIALLGGFAAKEVIISTLGTAYSLGEVDPEASTTLSQRLANDPGWNPVVASGGAGIHHVLRPLLRHSDLHRQRGGFMEMGSLFHGLQHPVCLRHGCGHLPDRRPALPPLNSAVFRLYTPESGAVLPPSALWRATAARLPAGRAHRPAPGFPPRRQIQHPVEVAGKTDHAMMGQERGAAITQGLDNAIRQILSAEGGVRCAPDTVAPGHGDHVMEGRDGPLQAGEHRTIWAMGMEDTPGPGIAMVDIAMHAPLGGRLALLCSTLGMTGKVQPDDIRRGAVLVRQRRRRDQKPVAAADAQIAGGGLIEPQLVHGPGGCQQFSPQGLVCHGHRRSG
jgi:ferrous iron transporter FeoB